MAYWNAASLARGKGQLAKCLQLMERAMILFGESDDQRNLPRIKNSYAERQAEAQLRLASTYRRQGDITACLHEASHAAATLEQAGTTAYASAALRELGDLYRELDLANDAMEAYSHALKCVGIHASDDRRNIPTSNGQQRLV